MTSRSRDVVHVRAGVSSPDDSPRKGLKIGEQVVVSGAVELRVTGPQAEPFIAEWEAGRATRSGPAKTVTLPRPEVPLRRVTVDRSVRELSSLMNGLVPPKGLPDGELIFADGPDLRRNAIVVTIDHQSDALLRALADRYGTAAIVIHIAPNPHAQPQSRTREAGV